MNPERWREIERLFHDALARPTAERAAFLAEACGTDEELRREVDSLLAHEDKSFLEKPALEAGAAGSNQELPQRPAAMKGLTVVHYRVQERLGGGGMGEVYQAEDTRLKRRVALKFLTVAPASSRPAAGMAALPDATALARFEREARLASALNHPNICAIYDVGEYDGRPFIAMELVEGETLAERIAVAPGSSVAAVYDRRPSVEKTAAHRAALQPDEALQIAKQIAEALEYAHERGIVHRDLKPANVKITPDGTVKVLDFGLAKAMGPDEASRDISNSPTLSAAMTQAGFILGTAAYMAPEQAKAKPVDRRADIWAFGCVLYEMLSGKKAFNGETISDVLAAVIMKDPDWTAFPESTPPAIDRLIRRCLVKDPKQRLRDIGEARIAIEETIAGGTGVSPAHGQDAHATEGERAGSPLRRFLPWAITGVLAAVAAIFAIGYAGRAPKPQPVIRFTVPPPENTHFPRVVGSMARVSPNGQEVAFLARSGPDSPPTLWVRSLDSLTAQQLQGTEGAGAPFWSPDSNYIGFATNTELEKIAVSGGPPQALCAAPVERSATWNQNGTIIFSSQGSLYSVPDTGGTPTLVASPNEAHRETVYVVPQFLPDGRHFIFTIVGRDGEYSIAVGSLGSKEIAQLAAADSGALYAPPGELLYLAGSTLMARPFDAKALRFTGQAVPVAESVGSTGGGPFGYFSVSPAGVLAYQTAPSVANGQMAWFNRDGKELGTLGPSAIYTNPAISPDGNKVAVDVGPQGKSNIGVYDLKRGTGSRLTFSSAYDFNPVWTSDGKQILFSSERKGPRDIYEKASNGLGATQLVYASKQDKSLDDVSPDGRYVVFDSGGGGGTSRKLGVLPLTGDRKPFTFVEGKFNVANAQFSPNGRYLAYVTAETGRDEVYVQTFPQHLGKWQISTAGGVDPVWGRDGKELYYLDPKSELMAVQVNTGSSAFQAGIPKLLFQAHIMPPWYWRSNYVVSPDGQRFLMLVPTGEAKPSPITVVVNWPELLKKP